MNVVEKENKPSSLWEEFMTSTERYRCITACRRSKKTEAMIQKILRESKDAVIVESLDTQVGDVYRRLITSIPGERYRIKLNELKIKKLIINDFSITIVSSTYEGDVETNNATDWYIEEPELFKKGIEHIAKQITSGEFHSLTMIGTLATREFTFFKGFLFYALNEGYAQVISVYELKEHGLISQEEIDEAKETFGEEFYDLEFLCKI